MSAMGPKYIQGRFNTQSPRHGHVIHARVIMSMVHGEHLPWWVDILHRVMSHLPGVGFKTLPWGKRPRSMVNVLPPMEDTDALCAMC